MKMTNFQNHFFTDTPMTSLLRSSSSPFTPNVSKSVENGNVHAFWEGSFHTTWLVFAAETIILPKSLVQLQKQKSPLRNVWFSALQPATELEGVGGKNTQLARQTACATKQITSKWHEGVLSCVSSSSEVFKNALSEPAASGGEWQSEGVKGVEVD